MRKPDAVPLSGGLRLATPRIQRRTRPAQRQRPPAGLRLPLPFTWPYLPH